VLIYINEKSTSTFSLEEFTNGARQFYELLITWFGMHDQLTIVQQNRLHFLMDNEHVPKQSFRQTYNTRPEDFWIVTNNEVQVVGNPGPFGFDRIAWKQAQEFVLKYK